jgi:hypothetical protein
MRALKEGERLVVGALVGACGGRGGGVVDVDKGRDGGKGGGGGGGSAGARSIISIGWRRPYVRFGARAPPRLYFFRPPLGAGGLGLLVASRRALHFFYTRNCSW